MDDLREDSQNIALRIISTIVNNRNRRETQPPTTNFTLEIPYYVTRYYNTDSIGGFNPHHDDIFSRTFNTKPTHKKVLSDDGLKSLQKVAYNPQEHKQKSCPILQTDFEEGEEITQLPCNHIFNTSAIERWLKEEKAECPMCRHSMHHKEVKVENAHEEEEHNHDDYLLNEVSSLMNSRINLYNSLSRLSSHPYGPRVDDSYEDITDLNRAILASIEQL